MGVELHAHENSHAEAEAPAVDLGLVAGDIPLFLQALDAAQARRRRQANPLGQLDIAEPAVLLQRSQDLAVQRVEVDWGIFSCQAFILRYFVARILAYCAIFAMIFAQHLQYVPLRWLNIGRNVRDGRDSEHFREAQAAGVAGGPGLRPDLERLDRVHPAWRDEGRSGRDARVAALRHSDAGHAAALGAQRSRLPEGRLAQMRDHGMRVGRAVLPDLLARHDLRAGFPCRRHAAGRHADVRRAVRVPAVRRTLWRGAAARLRDGSGGCPRSGWR